MAPAINEQQLLAALHWRYATKAFDPSRSIPAATWAALEQSLVLSPSSYGLQPWHFLVVQDPSLRQQLKPHSWNQGQITDASHLVVLLAKRSIDEADLDRLIHATSEARGVASASLAAYRELMHTNLVLGQQQQDLGTWTQKQVYIALGTLMAAAALLEVDSCPIEGFSPADYDRILELEDSPYSSAVVCALGYRAADDAYAALAKVRYPASSVISYR
jgi:nitroreductase